MKNLKKSKPLLLVTSFLLLLSIVGVWTYYNEGFSLGNPFTTGSPGVSIIEVFDPSDEWVPGEQKQKEVQIGNEGTVEMLMRFRVEASLYDDSDPRELLVDSTGNPTIEVDLINANGSVGQGPLFSIGWNNNEPDKYLDTHFQEITADGVTWYYYKKIMNANEKTENVIKYIEFSEKAGNNYQNYEAHVNVRAEFIQPDMEAVQESGWAAFEETADGTLTWK